MGLDITAYENIKESDAILKDGEPTDPKTGAYRDDAFICYINLDFPERAAGLKDRVCYSFQGAFKFRAGSYGGCNDWREELAKLAGYPKASATRWGGVIEQRHDVGALKVGKGPFFELIWFSDCEGFIGSEVSTKLANDFKEFESKAKDLPDPHNGWFFARYQDWKKAFEMASNNGAVSLH